MFGRLCALLAAFGVILIADASAVTVHKPLPDPLAAGWKGESVCELLHEDTARRLLRCTFPPGVGHERHYHAAHLGYVLAGGRMRITDDTGTREVDVKTGGTWTSEGIPWHEAVNIGDTTAAYLIFEIKPRSPETP